MAAMVLDGYLLLSLLSGLLSAVAAALGMSCLVALETLHFKNWFVPTHSRVHRDDESKTASMRSSVVSTSSRREKSKTQ